MTDTIKTFDHVPGNSPTTDEKARQVVAGYAHDAEDARELLGALGLLSTPVGKPVDKRRTA